MGNHYHASGRSLDGCSSLMHKRVKLGTMAMSGGSCYILSSHRVSPVQALSEQMEAKRVEAMAKKTYSNHE